MLMRKSALFPEQLTDKRDVARLAGSCYFSKLFYITIYCDYRPKKLQQVNETYAYSNAPNLDKMYNRFGKKNSADMHSIIYRETVIPIERNMN